MMAGCRFDAKRSLLLNYLPAALAHGAQIRPLHEVQRLSRTPEGGYRIHYDVIDDEDYRVTRGGGVIEAKIVVLAAGAGATPVILQRSTADLGAMPAAVGRYFSGNGERLNTAVVNDERARELLGLDRGDGTAYEAYQIGKGPCVATWTSSTRRCPSTAATPWNSCTSRRAWAPYSPRCPAPPGRPGSAGRRRRCCAGGAPG